MTDNPLVNKLAALSLAITDRALASSDDLAPTAVATLLSIKDRDHLTVGEVAEVVGLTHSAAVRLVDRLEKDWLVRRQRRVGREVQVEITARGRRKAQQLQDARLEAVTAFIDALDPDEQAAFDAMVAKIIRRQAADGIEPDKFCRMCRRGGCDCGLHADAKSD